MRKNGRRLTFAFERLDLDADLARALAGADLVTAAAFFDLVSPDWIERFCAELARRRLPLYAVLTYDGRESWTPPHAADAAMLDAFHRHQARDKGFGPAAGPRSSAMLREALERHGFEVQVGASPWRLGAGDAELIAALSRGRGGGRRANRPRRRGCNRRLARGAARGERLRNRACGYFRFPARGRLKQPKYLRRLARRGDRV